MSKGEIIKHVLALVIWGMKVCERVTETKQKWKGAGLSEWMRKSISRFLVQGSLHFTTHPSANPGVSSKPIALWRWSCEQIYVSWEAIIQKAFGHWNFPVVCMVTLGSYKEQYINMVEPKIQENKIRLESTQCNSPAVSFKNQFSF